MFFIRIIVKLQWKMIIRVLTCSTQVQRTNSDDSKKIALVRIGFSLILFYSTQLKLFARYYWKITEKLRSNARARQIFLHLKWSKIAWRRVRTACNTQLKRYCKVLLSTNLWISSTNRSSLKKLRPSTSTRQQRLRKTSKCGLITPDT